MLGIRKNDTVMVISGSEKGKQGRVLRIVPAAPGKAARVVVEKLKLVKKHAKPNQANRQGGIVEKEASIAISSVSLICPKEDRPRRFRMKMVGDKKVRVCAHAKCGEVIK